MKNWIKLFSNSIRKIYLFVFRVPPTERKRKRRKRSSDNASFGQFTTIRSVLGSLNDLFADIKLLEPKGKEFQRLAKRYGPYICSLSQEDDRGDRVLGTHLGEGFKAYGLPTFLIRYARKDWFAYKDDEEFASEFFVARKQTSLPFLKPKGAVNCYECCFVGLLENEKKPLELYFNIVIHDDGEVEAYPYLAQIPRRGKGGRILPGKMGLYYPDYSDSQKANIAERKEHLVKLFCVNYNMVMTRENSINIIIKKGKGRATITVPPNRWKYFFKDRMKIKTNKGNTRPIFHAVSSHHREYKTGKVVPIKTHYRGLRSFYWSGYSVKIILPGKHGQAQASFDVAGHVMGGAELPDGWLDMGGQEMSGKLNKYFEGGD